MPSTAKKIVLALVCLASACDGRRVIKAQDDGVPAAANHASVKSQSFAEMQQAGIRDNPQGTVVPLRALVLVLLAFNPSQAFTPAGPGARLANVNPGFAASHPAVMGKGYGVGGSRGRIPLMAAPSSYEKVADNCLEEGCPVNMIEELILELKAENEENPKPAIANTLEKLDKLLADRKEDMSTLEKLVESVARGSTSEVPKPETETLVYEKIAEDCLEEGCPIYSVEELLAKLKAEKNPNADIIETIKELEQVLSETKSRQSAIESLVADVSKAKKSVE